jgi:hypothetical protein
MKGQLIPFVFMILLVATVMIGYIFYNTYYGTNYQLQIFNTRVIDAVRNLIEGFKDYLKLSLTYSSHQALREHACLGGITGCEGQLGRSCPWILNGPNPVEVDQSKACLEAYTKYYLNVYTNLFNSSLPVMLAKGNSTEIIYGVDSEGVFSGKYDEGNFWVNSSGAKISISGTNINEYENVDMNDFVTKDRYWYMFRIFHDWAEADVYTPCICKALTCACSSSSSGEENCAANCLSEAEACADTALNDLQGRFNVKDNFVKCERNRDCCAQGIGPVCGDPPGCLGWSSRCLSQKEHSCVGPPPTEKLCPISQESSSSISESPFSTQSNPYYSKVSFQEEECWCHSEARLAAGYTFKCTDYKYYVPSEKGTVPLIFTADAIASLRDPWRCCTVCICPGCGC